MQIIGPDGQPVESAPRPRRDVPRAPMVASAEQTVVVDGNGGIALAPPAPEILVRMRGAQTTIDALEREFHQKKQRELAAAARSGGSPDGNQPQQRRTGDKVGRNDPCPCGSGKKYKKCHGANA